MSKKSKITSKDADWALRRHFELAGYKYHLSNKYLFKTIHGEWESDFMVMAKKSEYFSEVEIKVDASDFRQDFKKPKHKILNQIFDRGWSIEYSSYYNEKTPEETEEHVQQVVSRGGHPYSFIRIQTKDTLLLPHKFYYCYPEGLVPDKDVPPYAGILHMVGGHWKHKYQIRLVRKAPFLHKRKILKELHQDLLDKFFYESFNGIWNKNMAKP